ncbi:guanylate kinase [Blattabacterium cuenoti]|uniref:guanylate kinase n=1 Tax=Blattabacterium cuenoti TaxID=1653831 RepID=UPI00293BD406|nr:guanylate kinase [Blattabacterium cuenoti]
MIKQSKIIILSGPSGSGKTTISNYLISKIPNLKLSISCTTRKIRKNEKNGKDYFFISKKIFKSKIKKNQFLEWEEVYNNIFYGTLKNEINNLLKKKKYILFDIDVKGSINLKKLYKNESISIFILTNSKKILKNRLINRKLNNYKEIKIRLEKVKKENNYSNLFDFIILNEKLEKTKNKIFNIVYNFIKN